ncbi:hypothetical protein [Roseibium aggregatum]|uniref:hypothetical protein n=1 Tax=Roseibium aggregatum TaxID=187304 RepID=UPI001E3E6E46|nr:hypothetical protein [Roseibium aggregatum]
MRVKEAGMTKGKVPGRCRAGTAQKFQLAARVASDGKIRDRVKPVSQPDFQDT